MTAFPAGGSWSWDKRGLRQLKPLRCQPLLEEQVGGAGQEDGTMHAQDLRTAEQRLAAANRRLIELQEGGFDIGGLMGQLAFAHRALADGRTQDALALCEELQVSAKRLLDRQARGRARTEQLPMPDEQTMPRAAAQPRTAAEPRVVHPPQPPTVLVTRPPEPASADQVRTTALLPTPALDELAPSSEESSSTTVMPAMPGASTAAAPSATAAASAPTIAPAAVKVPSTDTIARIADDRLHAALDPAIEDLHQRLARDLASFEAETAERLSDGLSERFKALAAEPPTVRYAQDERLQATAVSAATAAESAQALAEDACAKAVGATGQAEQASLAADAARLEAEAAHGVAASAQQVAEDARLVAGVAQQAAASVEQTAASAQQAAASAQQAAESARQTAEQAHQAAASAQAAVASAQAVVDQAAGDARTAAGAAEEAKAAIAGLQSAIEDLRTMVAGIGERSAPIAVDVPSDGGGIPALEERLRAELLHQVQETTSRAMAEAADGLRSLQEAITGAVQSVVASSLVESRSALETGLREALAQVPSRAELDRLARDLRSDLTYHLEKVAAEKGWISLHEVDARLGSPPVPAPTSGDQVGGLVRLEAALVEFVRQSQSQQAEFMAAIQARIAEDASATRTMLTRALGRPARKPEQRPAAEVWDVPSPAPAEVRDETRSVAHLASPDLSGGMQEALQAGSAQDRLDALSRTQQLRSLGADGMPVQDDAPRPSTEVRAGSAITPRTPINLAEAAAAAQRAAEQMAESEPLPEGVAEALGTPPPMGSLDEESDYRPTRRATTTELTLASPEPRATADPATEFASSLAELAIQRPATALLPAVQPLPTDQVPSGIIAAADPLPHRSSSSPIPGLDSALAAALLAVDPSADTVDGAAASTLDRGAWDRSAAADAPDEAADAGADDAASDSAGAGLDDGEGSTDQTSPPRTAPRRLAVVAQVVAPTLPEAPVASGPASIDREVNRLVQATVGASLEQTANDIQAAVAEALDHARLEQARRIEEALPPQVREAVAKELDNRRVVGEREVYDALRRLLPELLKEPEVRTRILGLVAVEALTNPGVLGELTGLRAFLRHEVAKAARTVGEASGRHEHEAEMQEV